VTNIVPLNSERHRALRVQTRVSAQLGDNQRFVSVIAGEFPFLVPHFPIFFTKDANTGRFYCGAMLGFDEGENLFLDDDSAVYRPLNLQRGPFFAVGGDLAIDLDSPRVGSGEALFKESGEPTSYLESIMGAMRDLRPGLERTNAFIDGLMTLKLIAPIDIKVSFDDGTSRDLQGLYSISQDTLKNLPDKDVLDLFRKGYMHLIYLMIASLKQVPVLARRKNGRLLKGTEGLSQPLG
jgi:hypothetical protein